MSQTLARCFQVALLAAGSLMLPAVHGTCLAQAQDGGGPAGMAAPAANGRGRAIDLDFPGGTAVEFIDAIRRVAEGKVNIVTMPHVEEVNMPAMKLRSVDVMAALKLLDGELVQSAQRVVRLVVHPVGSSGPDSAMLIKVTAEVKESADFTGPQRSNIWSVADLMSGGMTADQITTAVSAALELIGADAPAAQVRFHKETSLLLARAEPEQIGVIHEVIAQLRQSSDQQRAQSTQPIREQIGQIQEELDRASVELRTAQAEALERLRAAETARARAEAMESRAAELEALTSRLRDELAQCESQLRAMRAEADELRAQLKKARGGG